MSEWVNKEALKGKKRGELVEIARDIGIEGLFSMTSTEIAEEIYERRSTADSSRLPSRGEEIEEKLMKLSRSDLVEIGRKVGIEGMFSMRSREIVEKICTSDNLGEFIRDIEEKAGRELNAENQDIQPNDGHQRTSDKPEKSMDISRAAEKIRSMDNKADAMEVVNEFDSSIEDLDLDSRDRKMNELFEKLGTHSESELGAREYIINICSTERAITTDSIADWVYDMYKDLGYPIDRKKNLGPFELMNSLHSGERYVAREIPYQEGW